MTARKHWQALCRVSAGKREKAQGAYICRTNLGRGVEVTNHSREPKTRPSLKPAAGDGLNLTPALLTSMVSASLARSGAGPVHRANVSKKVLEVALENIDMQPMVSVKICGEGRDAGATLSPPQSRVAEQLCALLSQAADVPKKRCSRLKYGDGVRPRVEGDRNEGWQDALLPQVAVSKVATAVAIRQKYRTARGQACSGKESNKRHRVYKKLVHLTPLARSLSYKVGSNLSFRIGCLRSRNVFILTP